MRNTIQKQIVYDVLKSLRTHPTAEEVYNIVKEKIPSVSLSTVYRILNQLYYEGKIKRLEINKEYHYDAYIHEHQHFVCKSCGRIIDMELEDINSSIKESLNKSSFKMESYEVIMFGICNDCLKQM